jgi:hypothetical protein
MSAQKSAVTVSFTASSNAMMVTTGTTTVAQPGAPSLMVGIATVEARLSPIHATSTAVMAETTGPSLEQTLVTMVTTQAETVALPAVSSRAAMNVKAVPTTVLTSVTRSVVMD